MKLVDYLRALLSQFVSKKDTGFIAEQSLPSASPVIYDGQLEYVAPKNGWAYGGINAVWEESGYVALKIGTSYMNQICYSGVGQGGGRLFFLPVKKGEKVILEHSSGKPLYLRFFENMGGGNLAHSIGGVLCLLGSSVHYLKRSLAVRKVGLVTSRCHQIKSLICLLSQIKHKVIQLHAMGGLLYLRKELEKAFVTLGHRISVAHLMAVGAQLLSCSEKANSLTTNSNQIRQTLEYSSSSPSALYNLSFGGASC